MQHTVFVRFFAVVLREYNVKLQKPLSYTFYGGNVVRVRVPFFITAALFHLALVATSISDFVTADTKFSCSSNKKMSPLFFISRSRSLKRSLPLHQFYTYFLFIFPGKEKAKKLEKSENCGYCLIMRKRIPLKCTTNI